jgi:hypothetical protein
MRVCVFCVSELVAKLEGCDWLSIIWKEKGKLMRKERKKKVCLCVVSGTIKEKHLAQNEQDHQNILSLFFTQDNDPVDCFTHVKVVFL